jgi:hypothetical protein
MRSQLLHLLKEKMTMICHLILIIDLLLLGWLAYDPACGCGVWTEVLNFKVSIFLIMNL